MRSRSRLISLVRSFERNQVILEMIRGCFFSYFFFTVMLHYFFLLTITVCRNVLPRQCKYNPTIKDFPLSLRLLERKETFVEAWDSSFSCSILAITRFLTTACTFSFQIHREDKREQSSFPLSELHERILEAKGSTGTPDLRVRATTKIPVSLLSPSVETDLESL